LFENHPRVGRKENFMNRKPIAVIGIYPTRIGVENAVEAFRVAGFQSGEISLLLPEKMSTEELFAEQATNTFEDATPGAPAVAAIDGTLGWLNEIGPAEISEECKFIVAGPIAEAFEQVASDRPSGTLAAALTSIGIPEVETVEYEGKIKQGGALLSVHCENEEGAEFARQLHSDVGGTNIFSTGWPQGGSNKLKRSMSKRAGR
jgi:hypothetical protein